MSNTRFILLGCILLGAPRAAEAQFTCTTNGGAITITGYTGSGGAVAIPDTINGLPVTSIGSEAFLDAASITSIFIPASVSTIGSQPFWYSTSLTAITVDPANPNYSSADGVLFNQSQTVLLDCPCAKPGNYQVPDSVTNIAENAFFACVSLTGVTIPSSVTSIGKTAFSECSGLTNATIPDSVTNIGDFAFTVCTSLTSVKISDTLTSIGNGVFEQCTSLTNVTIPNSVTSIGFEAFGFCGYLASVTVGNGVTSIADAAFRNCYYLNAVYFAGNGPANNDVAFVFYEDPFVMLYYLPRTTGWEQWFAFFPAALWLPQIDTGSSFGVQTNQFGFNVSWADGQTIVVEGSTDPANPVWQPLQTNTLTGGSFYFSDPEWTNYPSRFYRVRTP